MAKKSPSKSKKLRTPSGAPTAEARRMHSATGDMRFPIWDRESAESAMHLIGHNTTPEDQRKIRRKAARFIKVAPKK